MSKILKFQTKNQKKLEQMQAEQEKACDDFMVLINRVELIYIFSGKDIFMRLSMFTVQHNIINS